MKSQVRLSDAAKEWENNNQDDGYLYRGARLATAEEWFDAHHPQLTASEKGFLDASIGRKRKEEIIEKERARRLRRRAWVAAVTAVAAVAFAVTAFVKADSAERSFRHALDAVNDYFIEVSENDLLNQPGMLPLRRTLLDRGRQYYQKFVLKHAGDTKLQKELGLAHFRVGYVTELVDPSKAIPEYHNALNKQENSIKKNLKMSTRLHTL